MAGVRVEWHGDEVVREIDRLMNRRLRKVGEKVASTIRERLSTPTRSVGPSAPGEYPHAITGLLRNSVEYEVDEGKGVVRIGTNIEYGEYLEVGTEEMEARPFLERTVDDLEDQILVILSEPMN